MVSCSGIVSSKAPITFSYCCCFLLGYHFAMGWLIELLLGGGFPSGAIGGCVSLFIRILLIFLLLHMILSVITFFFGG